jgi:prenyltransferase beta subunit
MALHERRPADLGPSPTTPPHARLRQPEDLVYHLSDHIRLNGTYWALMALHILGRKDALDRDAMIAWVGSCWDDKAGASRQTTAAPAPPRLL